MKNLTLSFLLLATFSSVVAINGQQSGERTVKTTPRQAPSTGTTKRADDQAPVPLSLREQIEAAANPQDKLRLQLRLAEELAGEGKKTEALAELHSVALANTFDPQSFYNAGNSLARLGDTEEAVNAYRKAIVQRKGNYSRAYNNLGVVLMRAGRWDEAYEALLSALKLENFRYAEASYNLGRLYAARGETDRAVREWRRVLTINPAHEAAVEAIARIGNEGRVEVETNTAAVPPSAAKPSTVATPRTAVKPAAVKTISESRSPVLRVDPQTYEFLQRARSSSERGKTLDAVESYKRVIKLQNGYFAPANLELSYQLVLMKRYDEALSNLLLVSTRDGSRFPISYFHLARLYEMKGDLKSAESAFTQAVAAYQPANSQFLLDLSRVREKQGNLAGAVEAMEQYVAVMKQQGLAVNWSDERLSALRQKINSTK